MTKPIIKWVGGKRQLLAELTNRLPKLHFKHYTEPFFGGGALFFQIWEHLESAHLSDLNFDLISLYSAVKNNPHKLIEQFGRLPLMENTPNAYLSVRNIYNHIENDPLFKSACFIYLNKTGFNGLYRVNKSGKFNVPYGKNPNATICDKDAILEAHKAFKIAQISTRSFQTVRFDFSDEQMQGKDKDDYFVYFDPPYVPATTTANFTSYTTDGFTNTHQLELRDMCDYLTSQGIRWMQSNSYTPPVLEMYQKYNIDEVQARRSINRDGAKRGKVGEAIIRNYNDDGTIL